MRVLVRPVCLLLSCSLSVGVALAQRGDRAGESQQMLPDSVVVPEAVVRTPAQQLETFAIPAGCRVELFASEPMIHDPVVATFDAAGRLWVVEMRSYMKDLEATDEDEPTGRIVVLHDDDRDGRADRSTVFADELVLPRAVLPLRGGALVITPPDLVWMPDADGDLVADGREPIMGGFEAGTGNPEHSGNGLTWGFDHRIHLCNDKRMLRRTDEGFTIVPGAGGGQWGTCVDDRGRFYFNNNSDWLRCDLVPGGHGPWADEVGGMPALNHRVLSDQSVWPARPTPGINRGYQKQMLRSDYTLARTTAVCSPLVYRGSRLPFDGDVFICEPAGNCVRRAVLRDHDGVMTGDNAYRDEQREFLTSTDERFRPVDLVNGPDGALYVVDMYRGVIQHRNYVTSFLRQQIEKRGLAQPIALGRIWRIVPANDLPPAPWPDLDGAEPAVVVAALGHQTGAVRDLALRELVQRRLASLAPALRAAHAQDARPAVRIALLSALAGLDALQPADLRRSVRDDDAGVVAMALQHVGPWLARGDRHLWLMVDAIDRETPKTVRWHAALALGDAMRAEGQRGEDLVERSCAALARWIQQDPGDRMLIAAAATAVQERIPRLLAALQAAFAEPQTGSDDLGTDDRLAAVADLARRAVRTRDADAQLALFALARQASDEVRRALLQGAVAALPNGSRRTGFLLFPSAPPSLVQLANVDDADARRLAQTLLGAVRIDGDVMPGVVASLTVAEQQRVRAGEKLFRGACAACHQFDGRGQRGLAPPLRDSEWVLGPPDRLIRIALHGVKGPIEVDGEQWSLEMPGQGHLSDDELAQVLSYLRRAFGHQASCIEAAEVARHRKAGKQRGEAWTAAELLGTR